VNQLPSSRAAYSNCPPADAILSAEGCPCIWRPPLPDLQQLKPQQQRQSNLTLTARCPAGLRCSPCAAAALLAAGWLPQAGLNANVTTASDCRMLASEAQGVCLRCQIGERV
jgi:hypothetical protein